MANLKDILIYNYKGKKSILRSRTLTNRLRQQILTRVKIIKDMKLGYFHYLNLFPIALISILNYYGMKPDCLYNFIANEKVR